MTQGSMLVVQFNIQDLHRDTSKHTSSAKISTSDGYGWNEQVLYSVMNPAISLKGTMATHRSREDTMSDLPQPVSRKPQILDVEVPCIPCGRRSTPMPNGTLTYPLRASRIAGELVALWSVVSSFVKIGQRKKY